ncbi:MAG: aminotransferase class I/II-fold pyridoxal phosphate-dependent enzyme [Anaerolineales bacterium]|nr:aminotransferase class I/II-fold pyridoxal phosphate-dependent enzyme [Anaerolineales bacterium]
MPEVISLGVGEPDFVTPDLIINAGIESLKAGKTAYTSNSGIYELREAIAGHLHRLYAVKYSPKNEILITVGVSEALYLAMTALLDPGDEVIIPTPCFVAYSAEVLLAGGVPVEIPSKVEDDFEPDVIAIEKAVTPKTKAILIGYPNNPTGAVASLENMKKIAEIAEKNDLIVISDEIYDRLVYGVEHVCFPAIENMWDRTLLLSGFSKAYAMTGWRVGFAAGPAELISAMNNVHQYTIMSASTVSQNAAIEAILHGEDDVEFMRQEYDRRRRLIVDGMNEIGLPTFEPRGAFYAFPSIKNTGMDGYTFSQKLLNEQEVAAVPGEAFGPGGEGYLRCSYATDYNKIEVALERIYKFLRRI